MGGEQDLRRESELVERQTWDMSEEQQKASFEHWPKKFECVSYSENNLFKLYNWPHLCMCVCVRSGLHHQLGTKSLVTWVTSRGTKTTENPQNVNVWATLKQSAQVVQLAPFVYVCTGHFDDMGTKVS